MRATKQGEFELWKLRLYVNTLKGQELSGQKAGSVPMYASAPIGNNTGWDVAFLDAGAASVGSEG
jgi:hypothetical protein